MAGGGGEEVEVDVAIIGAGAQGLYLARGLAEEYRVCVLSDPTLPPATAAGSGLISAGYDGDDAARIQPARRAAGYWKLWAEANGLLDDTEPPVYVVGPDERAGRPHVWDDATLAHCATALPPILEGGSVADGDAYLAELDVVVHPGHLLAELRSGLEAVCLGGRVADVGLVGDIAVDRVEVQVGDRLLAVAARAVVVAAGAGNASLLSTIAKRLVDRERRRAAQEQARESQAVRHTTVVVVRGGTLPRLRGRFGELTVVSHPDGDDVVWHVTRPDHDRTTLGPVDLRFDPRPSPRHVAEVVGALLAAAPSLVGEIDRLAWATYGTRDAIHPAVVTEGTGRAARPLPSRLETLGLEGLYALWPSYLGQSMVLGDVVAERIADALGPSTAAGIDVTRTDLPLTRRDDGRARWERDDVGWSAWDEFAVAHHLDAPPDG